MILELLFCPFCGPVFSIFGMQFLVYMWVRLWSLHKLNFLGTHSGPVHIYYLSQEMLLRYLLQLGDHWMDTCNRNLYFVRCISSSTQVSYCILQIILLLTLSFLCFQTHHLFPLSPPPLQAYKHTTATNCDFVPLNMTYTWDEYHLVRWNYVLSNYILRV